MLIGHWRQWYKNGKIFSSGVYQDSKQVGDWFIFRLKILIALKLHIKMGALSMV